MRKGLIKNIKRLFAYLSLHNEKVITILVFVLVYGFIFLHLDARSVFTNTHLTGGDTGSHIYILEHLKEIFPRIRWWSPDWFGGFPFLYFYPPLMYILTVLLSYILPINIAFKLIIFSVVLVFPMSFYFSLKWLDMKFPIPQLGAVFSLFLIFLEKYSVYGGNLASLLSGEFSDTISIALLFMFVGLIYKGMKERKYLVWNCLLGAAVILTHPISGLLLILLFIAFPFQIKDIKKNIVYLIYVYLGIFLLSAFWSLGVLYYREYTGTMQWDIKVKLDELFPLYWLPLILSAGAGIVYATVKKERKLVGLFALLWISLLLYFSLDKSFVWNTRFLPYLSFGILLLSAYFIVSMLILVRKRAPMFFILAFVGILGISLYGAGQYATHSNSWFRWNFQGYEAKKPWPEADGLLQYLKTLPKGRVMWEHRPEYEKYGTTRTFEAIPLFSKQPTFEGLLVESSISAPFHFINQAETTDKPQTAVAGFDYPPLDFEKGIKHLEMSGAKYFVAYSDGIKEKANKNPSLSKLKDVGPFSIYEFKKSTLVEPIQDIEIQKKDKNWQEISLTWYREAKTEKPIVFTPNKNDENYLKNIQIQTGTNPVQNIKETGDSIEFDVENIGQPYLMKISYFPSWKAQGAEGPYLVSPSYILVVPTEKHVKLYFDYGWIDWLGIFLSLTGICYLVFLWRKGTKLLT